MKRVLLLCLLMTPQAFAVEVPHLNAPQPTDVKGQAAVRDPQAAPRMARVRIRLKLTEYDKLVIKNEQGVTRIDHKAVRTVQHILRARIERTNHFYVGNWHVETIPVSFDRTTLKYTAALRFSRKYGEGWDMEEYVGRVELNGTLAGKDFVYDMIGNNTAKFFSLKGEPLLDVEIGVNPLTTPIAKRAPEGSQGTVAKAIPAPAP